MPFPDDLLDQAKLLVHLDPNRPKQANLRRAVSTAYYAVFHLLAADAAAQASAARPAGLSIKVQRALDHKEMKDAAKGFKSSNLPEIIAPLINGGLPVELIAVADAFIRLQEERHRADYDLDSSFDRAKAQGAVVQATRTFKDWATVRNSDEAKVFLAALMFHKRWNR